MGISSCSAAPRQRLRALSALALPWALTGCALVSPVPLWELTKAGGAAGYAVLTQRPGEARQTVRHRHVPYEQVCIEFNPDCQVADLLPALQAELHRHQLQTRVLLAGGPGERCEVWLHYEAWLEWGLPPLRERYEPYLQQATLSLRTPDGRLVVTSRYRPEGLLETGRWASTREKLVPVVSALLTGEER